MNKVKMMLKGIWENSKHVASRYPVTMILIILASLSAAFFIDQDGSLGRFMEDRGIPFVIFWGIGTFFTETFWPGRKAAEWIGGAAGGCIAAGLILLGNSSADSVRELASHWKTAYAIVLISLGVYRNFKNSERPFAQYCIGVEYGVSRLGIFCSVAGLGIALVMAVFVTLILNGEHYMLILRAEFLILGILTGSGLLDVQIREEKELPRFFIVIVRYLLMTLLLAAFAVIYVYILKIIITQVVPSNEIFRILAGLFIIGLPIWTMIGTFSEDHVLVRIGVKLPFVFIPFLFLQGYAIRVRIMAYGLTPFRCLCLVLMLFEVIYITVYAFRKRETGIMLPVTAALAVICLVLPAVNIFSISNRSQKTIFDRYIGAEFSELSTEDQSSLAGAYYYLDGNPEGRSMLADADPVKIEAIKESGKIGNIEYDRNVYADHTFPLISEDISEFSRITMVSNQNRISETTKETYDPAAVEFYDPEGRLVLTADLRSFVGSCLSEAGNTPFGIPDHSGVIALDSGRVLYVTHCVVGAVPDESVSYLYIDALLFEK